MDAVAVRALCSQTGDERHVVRVAPGIFKDAFGVLRINFASSAGPVTWCGRFATDQTLGPEQLLVLPQWLCLYHDLSTPFQVTAELVQTVSICGAVRLARLFGQLPDSPKARADLCVQLRGQVVSAGAILPVIVWGQEEYYRVLDIALEEDDKAGATTPNFPTKTGAEAASKTAISPSGEATAPAPLKSAVFLIGKETKVTLEWTEETLHFDQPDCDVQELVERIRTHLLYCSVASKCVRQDYASGVCPNFILLGGLDWNDTQQIQELLRHQHSWTVHNLPLALLIGDAEVEGREEDSIKRRQIFQTVLRELTARQDRTVLWLMGLEFLGPTTLKSLAEILGEARIGHDGNVCTIAPVLVEGAAARLHRVFYGSALLEMRSPRQGLSRQETFEHTYNVEGAGMAVERSLELVREAARFARGELVGEVLRRDLGSWDHIYGYERVKSRLRFLVELGLFSGAPARRLGIEPVKGILLHGPSGCGKSELIRALANCLSVPIIHVRPARVLSKYLGESEASLRALFSRARKSAPCVLFIDNMEVLGARRSKWG